MYTFHKTYTTDTVERIIPLHSGMIPVVKDVFVNGANGFVQLRTYPGSGAMVDVSGEYQLRDISATGAIHQAVEADISGSAIVTVNYIYNNSFEMNSQQRPHGIMDYRGT